MTTLTRKRPLFSLACCCLVVLSGVTVSSDTAAQEGEGADTAASEIEGSEGTEEGVSEGEGEEADADAAALLGGRVGQRIVDASTIILGFPDALGALERPALEFKHAVHTEALEEEGCEACHAFDEDRRFDPRLKQIEDVSDRDGLTDQYHDACMGCHKERSKEGKSAGPITCGECHARNPEPVSTFQDMSYDYSLHDRHIQAMEEKCEECHHVYNEYADRLEYEEGAEDACNTCHADEDDGDNLSWRNASHVHCLSCHLDRQEKALEGGPVLCDGCHELEGQRNIKKAPDVARLDRGQPDKVWIYALNARDNMVPFDHEAHETRTDFCTDCHRCTEEGPGPASNGIWGKPEACKECHTVNGKATLEKAFHSPTAGHACVGCHKNETLESDCAGCHSMIPGQMPFDRSCNVCHSGPLAQIGMFAASAPFPADVRLENLMVHLRDEQATIDDFPETVIIGTLAEEYEPVEMPHRLMVVRLDAVVRESKLATQFHGQTETNCAGCHHNAPIGERPTPCGSCHGLESETARDMPGLEAAYHRQCIGCHQRMGVEKQGCTDCHAKTAVETPAEIPAEGSYKPPEEGF